MGSMYSLVAALSVLVLSKMTAFVFLPMVVCFYAVLYSKRRGFIGSFSYWSTIASALSVPLLFWVIFNRFMTGYDAFDGGVQGYAHFTPDIIWNVLSHNGVIYYQFDVEREFFRALIKNPVAFNLPYIQAIIGCIVILLLWAKLSERDADIIRSTKLLALWNLLAGIGYAAMMWFLYLTAFSESEARDLASFDRYMSSYIIAIFLLDISFVLSRIRQLSRVVMLSSVAAAVCLIVSSILGTADQLFPGNIGGWWQVETDEPAFEWEVSNLKNKLPENANVYVLSVGGSESDIVPMAYRLSPMVIFGSGLDFVNYQTMTPESFMKKMAKREYIYVRWLKDGSEDFIEKYSGCFEDTSGLYPGAILKIDSIEDSIIKYHVIDEISLGDE